MNAIDLDQIVDALTRIAALLEPLGLPGFVALMLSGPALILCSVIYVEYRRSQSDRRMLEAAREEMRTLLEAYRADMQATQEAHRQENGRLVEIYRSDTQKILRELGSGINKISGYYEDNVILVKQYKDISDGFLDVVVSNTRAVEKLTVLLEERRRHE